MNGNRPLLMSPVVLAWVMLIALSLIWGSSFILIKRGLVGFDYLEVGVLRLSISALAFLPLALWHMRYLDKGRVWYLVLVGLLGSALPGLLFAIAQTHLPSVVAGILNSLTPLFALLFGILWFGQQWKAIWVVGVGIGLAGAVILIVTQHQADLALGLMGNYLHAGWIILATICYATSVNIVKRYLQEVPSLRISAFSFFLVGTPAWLLIAPVGVPQTIAESPDIAWPALGYIAVLALAGTVVATLIFYRLVQLTNVVFSSSVAYLIPVVAMMWGYLDGEPFSLWHLGGALMILSGVYLTKR
jgi:drug/metabolite transporter (DMT)-like permease